MITWMHEHQEATVWLVVGVVVAVGAVAAWRLHRPARLDAKRHRVAMAVEDARQAGESAGRRFAVAVGRARVPLSMYEPKHAAETALYRSAVAR